MSTPGSCSVGASKSNDDDVCEMAGKLEKIKTSEDNEEEDVSVCANCGKEGNDINNKCNKCKQVKYCNAACKKKHRHKHKKQCDEHQRLAAAERAAKLHEALFKQPPKEEEDCPICFLRLPLINTGRRYQTCCGKNICSGCIHAPLYDDQGNEVDNEKCPFCRAPMPTSNEESDDRKKKRAEANDAGAICNLGNYYRDGISGYPKDYTKALEYWHRAAELGSAGAYNNIGFAYALGKGVEKDKIEAIYYYMLGAVGGDIKARYNLGLMEEKFGNNERAVKHYMIATRGGHAYSSGNADSLKRIKQLYSDGDASKDDYMKALQSYQEYLDEIKSLQRDKAAETHENCRYY